MYLKPSPLRFRCCPGWLSETFKGHGLVLYTFLNRIVAQRFYRAYFAYWVKSIVLRRQSFKLFSAGTTILLCPITQMLICGNSLGVAATTLDLHNCCSNRWILTECSDAAPPRSSSSRYRHPLCRHRGRGAYRILQHTRLLEPWDENRRRIRGRSDTEWDKQWEHKGKPQVGVYVFSLK